MRRDVPAAPRPDATPPPPKVREGEWVLELPFVKPLSLNDRMIWQVRQRQVRPWRDAAKKLAEAAKIPPCRRVTIELNYVPRDDRARDALNLTASLKACEDGIVDAEVIPDDNGRYHTSVMPIIHPKGPVRPNGNRLWLVVTAHD